MMRMGINYCDCSGIMARCKAKDDRIGQTLCDFSSGVNGCMNLRKDMDNHCDNPEAQHEARHGIPMRAAEPLTEDTVFDVRDRNTYPTYQRR